MARFATIFLGMPLVGCGGSSGIGGPGTSTGNIPADLVGSWETSCSVVVDPTGGFDPLNLVAIERVFSLSLGSDGRYVRSETLSNRTIETTGGAFSVPTNLVIEFVPDGGPPSFRWNYMTAEFTLAFVFSDGWDFDGDGVESETGDFRVEMNKAGRDPMCLSIGVAIPGAWTATSILITNPVGGQQLQLTDTGGAFALALSAGGSFSSSFTMPGAAAPDTAVGRFAVIDETLYFHGVDGETFERDFVSGDSTLTINYEDSFDFDGNGVAEDAVYDISMAIE